MRNFEQRKAEVLRRSGNAIAERKRSIKYSCTIFAILVLCVSTLMASNVIPFGDTVADNSSGQASSVTKPNVEENVDGIPGIDVDSAADDFTNGQSPVNSDNDLRDEPTATTEEQTEENK